MPTSPMPNFPAWHYDEFHQVGTDYTDPQQVAVYDESHASFRDIRRECHALLDRLDLPGDATLADFGCGTGVLAVEAARRGFRVHALDISPAMLAHARERAANAGVLDRITFHHRGFLTHTLTDGSLDAATSSLVLHHLPDLWKSIALRRLCDALKPGAGFFLRDVVAENETPLKTIGDFIGRQAHRGGDFMRTDAERHFAEEFSTLEWIMTGLLQRAGFVVRERHWADGVFAEYWLEKPTA